MDIQCKGFPQLRNEQADLYSNVGTYQQPMQVQCMFRLYKYIYIHTHSMCVYICIQAVTEDSCCHIFNSEKQPSADPEHFFVRLLC